MPPWPQPIRAAAPPPPWKWDTKDETVYGTLDSRRSTGRGRWTWECALYNRRMLLTSPRAHHDRPIRHKGKEVLEEVGCTLFSVIHRIILQRILQIKRIHIKRIQRNPRKIGKFFCIVTWLDNSSWIGDNILRFFCTVTVVTLSTCSWNRGVQTKIEWSPRFYMHISSNQMTKLYTWFPYSLFEFMKPFWQYFVLVLLLLLL